MDEHCANCSETGCCMLNPLSKKQKILHATEKVDIDYVLDNEDAVFAFVLDTCLNCESSLKKSGEFLWAKQFREEFTELKQKKIVVKVYNVLKDENYYSRDFAHRLTVQAFSTIWGRASYPKPPKYSVAAPVSDSAKEVIRKLLDENPPPFKN